MTTVKKLSVAHWATTIVFSLALTWSAVLYLTRAPAMIEVMTVHLGYPLYFVMILGIAKLLGVATLIFAPWPRLKEWAYAGFTIDLIGAFLSHLSVGDPIGRALIPIGFLALLAVSYASWRRIGRRPPGTLDTATRPAGPPLEGARAVF